MTGEDTGAAPAAAPLPGPIMVVHARYQQRAGEDAEVDAEIDNLRSHGHDVIRFIVDNRSIQPAGVGAKARVAVETVWSRRAARQLEATAREARPAVAHVHNTFPLLSPAIYRPLDQSGAAIVQSIHNYRAVCASANLFRDGHDCTDCVGRRFAWPAIVHGCYRDSPAQSAVVAASQAASRVSGAWERSVDRFIAPSRAVADALAGRAVPADRIAIKPNFLAGSPSVGPAGDRPDAYLFAGRLAPEKGVLTIAAAWAALGDSAAVGRIAGSGPLDGEVADAAAADRRLVPLGALDRPAMSDELGRARAVIFPSVWREPFGLVVIEAFASGTPVIAARIGAPADLVEDGVTGLLFDPGDAADLADRIRWASAHPAEMAAMGGRARDAYEQRYSAEVNYRQLAQVYRDAIAHRRARGGETVAGETVASQADGAATTTTRG